MTKPILSLSFLLMLSFACKKESTKDPEPVTPVNTADQTLPVISLLGKKNDSISLQSSYSDPGATALDDKDGDISPFIVVSGTVNTNAVGTYLKEYNVRDAAGNIAVKATRTIKVKNDINYMAGNYLVACSCQTMEPGVSTLSNTSNFSALVVPSSSVNGSFNLSNVNNGFVIQAFNLSANATNLSGFNSPGSLTGTISVSKTSFTISALSYEINYPSRIRQCENVYTKQ